MNLPNVDSQDFVRSSGGGGGSGGSVDVGAITKAATDGAVKAAVPAATQAATQAVVAAVPQLVAQQTTGLKQEIKSELKPADLYAEYQEGVWAPKTSDVVAGAGNNSVYRLNFPKPFSDVPIVELDMESGANRIYQLHSITATSFDWGTNYGGTGVLVRWQAYVKKP